MSTVTHNGWTQPLSAVLSHRGMSRRKRLELEAFGSWLEDALPRAASLTTMQRSVIALVADGMNNAQIAGVLGISDQTVKNHLTTSYRLLGMDPRSCNSRARIAYLVGHMDGLREASHGA